ncbi:MAG TPA: polyprenyl synthetase family protein, partial [Candidatus Eisenbacteria bacterium]|nr:polyprenyl synthetase family protein [Candidatus Eisenbacteria bacterium]
MARGSRLVDLVQTRIEDFLAERTSILRSISPDLDPLDAFSRRFLSGGKRFRARFCYWGWEAVDAPGFDPFESDGGRDHYPVVSAASALELFHAAALV